MIKIKNNIIHASEEDYNLIYETLCGVNEILYEQCPSLRDAGFDLADFLENYMYLIELEDDEG